MQLFNKAASDLIRDAPGARFTAISYASARSGLTLSNVESLGFSTHTQWLRP
jgi:hypothetical protein